MYLDGARVLQMSLLNWFIKQEAWKFLKFATIETGLAEVKIKQFIENYLVNRNQTISRTERRRNQIPMAVSIQLYCASQEVGSNTGGIKKNSARIHRGMKKVRQINNNRNSIAHSRDIFRVYCIDLDLLPIMFVNISETSEVAKQKFTCVCY